MINSKLSVEKSWVMQKTERDRDEENVLRKFTQWSKQDAEGC